MASGARFQKQREAGGGGGGGGGRATKRAELSEGHRELHSQREIDSQWLTCFSVKVLFLRQHFY